MHWILSREPQNTSTVPLIEDALMCPEFLVDPSIESRNRWLQGKLTMSQEEIEEVCDNHAIVMCHLNKSSEQFICLS